MLIKKVMLPKECRIICISDIHAHYDDFVKLLQKCEYDSENDYLFILGDILEKGRQNIQILQYVKRLCENPKTICIKGNNDTQCERMAFSDSKEKFMSRLINRPQNAFVDMANAIQITNFENDFDEKRKSIIHNFSSELQFINDMPLAIETEKYVFVHAGIENRKDWENSDEEVVLCEDWFFNKEHCIDKHVVVGHYPTYNFEKSDNTCLPIIDNEKRIIAIDGGCEVKWAGQLNAFIINKNGDQYSYNTVFQPLVPAHKVKRDVVSEYAYIYLNYDDCDLEVLENKGDFILVYNKINSTRGIIPACCISEWGGKLHGWINLNSFISVNKGENFYVYGEIGEYYFGIEQNGKVGLVLKSHIL